MSAQTVAHDVYVRRIDGREIHQVFQQLGDHGTDAIRQVGRHRVQQVAGHPAPVRGDDVVISARHVSCTRKGEKRTLQYCSAVSRR